MSFVLQRYAPGIERVIHDEPVTEHLVIVRDRRGEAKRDGIETCALRREIEPRGVGGPNDQRQPLQARIGQLVFGDKGIEAAPLPDMTQLHTRNVIRDSPGVLRDGEHLGRRDVQEFGIRLDESQDQPRAGDPIYFRALASNPFHGWLVTG